MQTWLSRESQMMRNPQPGLFGRLFGGFVGSRSIPSGVRDPLGDSAAEPLIVSFREENLFATDVTERCKITCLAGMVWITSQDRSCDYVLKAGESLELRRPTKVLVSGDAREDSAVQVWKG